MKFAGLRLYNEDIHFDMARDLPFPLTVGRPLWAVKSNDIHQKARYDFV